ncbi:MAG: fibronectin type III domain-containing protein [Caldilineaceae bacterium]
MRRGYKVTLLPFIAASLFTLLFLALNHNDVPRLFAVDNTQESRDVGAVRIYADNFIEISGTITATGNIKLGPVASDNQWYSISQEAVWISATKKMTLTGQLAIAGSNQIISGVFPVSGVTGDLTIPTDALNLYRKLGDSQIAITPTFKINIANPQITANAQVSLTLPEGNLRPNIQFILGQAGKITGTAVVPIHLKLAGGTLTSTVTITQSGLSALKSDYVIGDVKVTLRDLLINGEGDLKIKFGTELDFPIDDFAVDSDFFKLANVRGKLGLKQANGQITGYEIGLTGNVKLDKLPENGSVTAKGTSLKFADGSLVGSVEGFKIKVSGNNFNLSGVSFVYPLVAVQSADGQSINAAKRVLLVDTAEYELPKEFRPIDEITPTVRLRNVYLQPTAPYVTLQGAGITLAIGKDYYLGGNANSTNSVKLSAITGRVDYNFTSNAWSTSITGTLGIKLGDGVATSVTANLSANGTGSDLGKYKGRIIGVTLDVAGAQLAITNLDFKANAFTATSASLSLPQNFGNITVNNIRIDQNGLRLDNGTFALPDIPFNALKLTENSGAFAIAGLQYTIDVTSTIRVEGGATSLPGSGGGTGVLVRGLLHIRNGRVTGAIDQFGFTLSGAEFRLTNPRFLDNRIIADQASVSIPTGGGTVTASANGIEIGGTAGFKFRQPTIQMTDFVIAGIGIRNPHLKFEQSGNNYIVTGGATVQFTQFSVAGEFTIRKTSNFIELDPVVLDFRSTPGIPLGQTGFELTRIRGQFNLTRNTAIVEMGVRIESQTKVIIPLVSMDGTIRLQVLPRFDLRASAGVQVVGINVSTADLHITPTAATLDGTLEYQIARQIVDLSFGEDSNGEFTMYGSMRSELGLKKGSLIHWCVPFVPCVDVPPYDFTVASVTYDAGKFQDRRTSTVKTVWGGRAQFTVFGNRAYAFLRLAPSPQDIIVGTDLDDYRAVAPGLTAAEIYAPNAPYYVDANGFHTFEITRQAELLVFAEAITVTNMGLPAQPLLVTSPKGENFILQPFYVADDQTSRLYSINYATPPDAVGTWHVTSAAGNAVKMWGQRPGVQISRFEVRTPNNDLIPVVGSPVVELHNGDTLQLDLEVKKPEPGMQVQFFAEDGSGVRTPILDLSDQTQATWSIQQGWSINLPAGTYTLTMIADDFGNSMAVTNTVAVQVVDNQPPAVLANLTVQPQLDGSVKLSWNESDDLDVKGYRISVVNGPTIDIDGVRDSYTVAGLEPGSNQTFAVQAYDSSGNVGNAASDHLTLPTFRLESVTPLAEVPNSDLMQISAAFNQPIQSATITLVNADGQTINGVVSGISVETNVNLFELYGADFHLESSLPAGSYSATVNAQKLGGETVSWTWSFTLMEPVQNLFLPLLSR